MSMLLETRTKNSSEWKALVSYFRSISDEATFEAKKDGLYFRNIDPSHVAMIDFHWTNTAFEKFKCTDDVKFAVIVSKLSDIIKRAKKDDCLEFGVSEDLNLVIRIGDRKEFVIRTLEPRSAVLPLPNIPFTVNMEVNKSELDDVIDDLSIVTETMEVNVTKNPDKVVFSGKGDLGKVSSEITPVKLSVETEAYSAYALDYIRSISKNIDYSTAVIKLSNKTPMKISVPFGTEQIDYFVAPRSNI